MFSSERRRTRHLAGAALIGSLATTGCFDLSYAEYLPPPEPEAPAEPTVSWVRDIGGRGEHLLNYVDVFSDSAVIAGGTFATTAIFGRGEDQETRFDNTDGLNDSYVARYRASGELQWARHLDTTGNMLLNDVVALPDGTSVVTGWFSDTLSVHTTELTATASSDMFLAAFGPTGEVRWAIREGGAFDEHGETLTTAPGQTPRIIVAGGFVGDLTLGQGSARVELVDAPDANSQGFIAAYDTEGGLAWATQTHGAAVLEDVVVAGSEAIVAGRFWGNMTLGAEELTADGDHDAFIAGLDVRDGMLRWVQRFGGAGAAGASAVDASADGTVAVAVTFSGQLRIESFERDAQDAEEVVVARFEHPERTLSWVRGISSNKIVRCDTLALRGDNVTVGGHFSGSMRIDGVADSRTELTAAGFDDGFVARFGADGTADWALPLGGVLLRDAVHRVVAPTDSALVVSGLFEEALSVGGEAELLRTSGAAASDAFVMRLDVAQ